MASSNFASGFNRVVAYGKETTFGTKPSRGSGTVLRRTAVDINPEKDSITSNEIRSDFQRVEFRHGIRRATGNINTEIGLGTHKDFLQSLLRRDFTANSAVTYTASASDGITLAASGGTATRAAGGSGDSFLTDGFKEGDVVRFTGSAVPTALSEKNIRITSVTDTVITSPDITADLSSTTSNFTITVIGETTYMPTTGHTSDCYTVEVYEQGLDKSIAYVGTRIGSATIDISPTAITTANFGVISKDFERIEESGGSSTDVPYFQSPTAAGTGTLVAGPNGTLRLGSNDLAVVTSASITIDNNISADPVIGANTVPEIFYSGQTVSGQFTLFTQDLQMLTDFDNEAELSFQIVMEEPVTSGFPGFVSIYIPRLKISGFQIPDNANAIVQTVNFEALKVASADSDQRDTQIIIQDSTT